MGKIKIAIAGLMVISTLATSGCVFFDPFWWGDGGHHHGGHDGGG